MTEEPVNIDIVLRQNVADEADKASRGIDNMTASSEEAWKRSKEALQLQRDVIARLKKELEPLQKAFDKVNIGTNDPAVIAQREKLSKAVREVTTELRGEEEALKEMMGASDKTAQKAEALETRIRKVRDAMAELALAGQRDSELYREKAEELNTLSVAYKEVSNTQNQLQKGGANLQGIVSGISGITGVMSAGAGAFGLFNQEAEEFQKIQTKVQSLMAITIGLQQVQNTLHQTSAFRIQTVTRAKQLWSAANQKLAVSLGLSNVAAKALMGTLSLGLTVVVGFLINQIDKYVAKQREAREEQSRLAESVSQNAASQLATYEKLKRSYQSLGDEVKAKEQFVLDNQDAFKQLGVAINDVNDADNAFILNTDAFKSAIVQRARATAAMEVAAEKYKDAMKKREEAKQRLNNPTKWDKMTSLGTNDWVYDENSKKNVLRNSSAIKAAKEMNDEAAKLEEAAKKSVDAYLDYKQQEADILKGLGLDKFKKQNKATNKSTQDKLTDDTQKAAEKLKRLSADIQRETDAAIVAAMEEGRDKKLAELKADYDARMELITSRKKEIEALENTTGIDASKQKTQLDELAKAEEAKYKVNEQIIKNGASKAISAIMDDINSRFRTANENRIAQINAFYNEQRKKAKENAATQAQLDELDLQHKRDIELEKQQIALETLDFEMQIAMKRAGMENKRVLLQTVREEKILQVQIKAAEKRLQKLKEIQAKGGDVEKEIQATSIAIQGMNSELEAIPVKKMQEVAEIAKGIADVISDIAGIAGTDSENLADILTGYYGGSAEFGMGLTRAAMGDPQGVQQMINGIKKALGSVKKIINANKEANKEISKFNQTLAQQAIDYSLAVIKSIKDIKSETDSIFSKSSDNVLAKGMSSYNTAIAKQKELMNQLGDATVKTGVKKKKFLFVTYGTKDIYDNLLKKYPALIDSSGKLNRELAESLKKSGNLTDGTAQLLDNIISAGDAAAEAMSAVENELQSLIGNIGTDLKNALDDAFASGTDSAKVFGNSLSKTLGQVMSNSVFNAIFGAKLKKLQEDIKATAGEGKGSGSMLTVIKKFFEDYRQEEERYKNDTEQVGKYLKENFGFNPYEQEDKRSAVAKGIAQASQDSIDELNGRLTFIVMKVSEIGSINGTCVDVNREQLLVLQAMLSHIELIAENSEFLRKLDDISFCIDKVVREGLYLKK